MSGFNRYGRRRGHKKKRPGPKPAQREGWRLKDERAVLSAWALIEEMAQNTGQTLEETIAALERLEADGLIRREPDGAIVLLTQAS